MKKIGLILFLFLAIIKVNALEYGVWTDEVSSDENSKVVSSETRYKWYKNSELKSTDYYIEGENDVSYPYIIASDYKKTEWSSWSDVRPDSKLNRTIKSKPATRYRTMRPIRYLFIADLTSSTSITKISKINVLINNVKIPISLTCQNCNPNFDNNISNGIFQDEFFINNGAVITIDLGNYFNINEIGLEMFMYDDIGDTKTFYVYYNEGNTIPDRNYAKKYVNVYVDQKKYYEASRFYVIPDAKSITNPIYNDWIYIDKLINATYYKQVQITNLYSYKDILYRYYKIERTYLDGYYSNAEDSSYIKDEESAKTYYLYEYIDQVNDNTNQSEESDNNGQIVNDSSGTEEDLVIENQSSDTSNQSEEEPELDDSTNTSAYLNEQNTSLDKNTNNIVLDNENVALELDKNIIPKKENNDKVTIKKENIIYKLFNNFVNNISSKMYIICTILIFLTIIVIFKLRHHILSHQK
jgi:hypothetical protein